MSPRRRFWPKPTAPCRPPSWPPPPDARASTCSATARSCLKKWPKSGASIASSIRISRRKPPSASTWTTSITATRCTPWRPPPALDRKSTRLNSSHRCISDAVLCLKKKRSDPIDGMGRRHHRAGGGLLGGAHSLVRGPVHALAIRVRVPPASFLPGLFFFLRIRRPPRSTLFPYPRLFRSQRDYQANGQRPPDPVISAVHPDW